jgi:hypothetical protein
MKFIQANRNRQRFERGFWNINFYDRSNRQKLELWILDDKFNHDSRSWQRFELGFYGHK